MKKRAPYTARQCPVCGKWIAVRSHKSDEDFNHYVKHHSEQLSPTTGAVTAFPFFNFNEEEVTV